MADHFSNSSSSVVRKNSKSTPAPSAVRRQAPDCVDPAPDPGSEEKDRDRVCRLTQRNHLHPRWKSRHRGWSVSACPRIGETPLQCCKSLLTGTPRGGSFDQSWNSDPLTVAFTYSLRIQKSPNRSPSSRLLAKSVRIGSSASKISSCVIACR